MNDAAGRHEDFYVPDKNVLIDAVEALAPVSLDIDAFRQLQASNPHLTQLPNDSRLLAGLLRARNLRALAAEVDAGSVTAAELTGDPQPASAGWMIRVLQRSTDLKVLDFAANAQSGRLVLTTEVLDHSQMILQGKLSKLFGEERGMPAATRLTQDLARQALFVLDVPKTRKQAIADGDLDPYLQLMREEAPMHLAAINLASPYWSIRRDVLDALPATPDGQSWAKFKLEHPEVYGIEGEDLFIMLQLALVKERLSAALAEVTPPGSPVPDVRVIFGTGDEHLARALVRMNLFPVTLYHKPAETVEATDMTPRRAPWKMPRGPLPAPAQQRQYAAGTRINSRGGVT